MYGFSKFSHPSTVSGSNHVKAAGRYILIYLVMDGIEITHNSKEPNCNLWINISVC